MKSKLNCLRAALIAAASLGLAAVQATAQPKPLIHAHAHNDYLHARPLLDALDRGFCSVEADIYLVEGKLLVAHDRDKVKPERTLQSLYLDPLRERVKKYGGRVFANGPEFSLLIDLKSEWQTTYPVLRSVLTNYADVLSAFPDGAKRTNAILVVLSGNRDRAMFAGETTRYAALDGELSVLDAKSPATLVPWVSGRWGATFSWRGKDAIPDAELQKLRALVKQAHDQGRRVRFWGAPDFVAFWRVLRAAGVDLINTDDLQGAQEFLGAN